MLDFTISTLACPQLQSSIQQHYKQNLDLDEALKFSCFGFDFLNKIEFLCQKIETLVLRKEISQIQVQGVSASLVQSHLVQSTV